MRTYLNNSPQAAARIVALAMLADGELAEAELEVLDRLRVQEQLGLRPEELHVVVNAMCDDLLWEAQLSWADTCRVDPATVAEMMAEIDERDLRLTVLRLCVAVVEADDHIDEGESILLTAAVEQWGLHRWMLQAQPARRYAAHA